MRDLKIVFSQTTTAGCTRAEGVILVIVSHWVNQGGIEGLESVADQCDFSEIYCKRDDIVGGVILAKRDYYQEMLDYIKTSPFHVYAIDVLNLNFPSSTGWRPDLKRTLQGYVGQSLFDSGWWTRNEKRIKKERKNHKNVAQVMES